MSRRRSLSLSLPLPLLLSPFILPPLASCSPCANKMIWFDIAEIKYRDKSGKSGAHIGSGRLCLSLYISAAALLSLSEVNFTSPVAVSGALIFSRGFLSLYINIMQVDDYFCACQREKEREKKEEEYTFYKR